MIDPSYALPMHATTHAWGDEPTPFDALGGEERILAIVERFYDIVDEEAPVLRAMLPADDSVSRRKLALYLVEWTGGPARYSAERGHPRMRMRHLPFSIGADEVATWLACFGKSLDENGVTGDVRVFLDEKVSALAHHLQNG